MTYLCAILGIVMCARRHCTWNPGYRSLDAEICQLRHLQRRINMQAAMLSLSKAERSDYRDRKARIAGVASLLRRSTLAPRSFKLTHSPLS